MDYLNRIFKFYYEGFRDMKLGKTLWAIVLIKIFIIFAVFRLFFFHDFLGAKFRTSEEKSDYVIEQLITNPK